MKISALIAENVRNFEGEHIIDLDEGLNVFIGKNNTGKSTLLRIPGLVARQFVGAPKVSLPTEMSRPKTHFNQFGLRLRSLRQVSAPFSTSVRQSTVMYASSSQSSRNSFPSDPTLDALVRTDARVSGRSFRFAGITWADGFTTPAEWRFARSPEAELLLTDLRKHFDSGQSSFWAHRPFGNSDTDQHPKRLHDADEAQLQATLTFLKLKHEEHFASLASAIQRALPEFGRLDFEEFGADYKPAFKLNHADQLLTRDLVGSGSWTFLSVLTAAHAAVATGAETIVLDEPHLYLHPGLERRLVRELTNEETWKGKAPQLLVATHSPVFLDAAWRNGKVYLLDWEDEKRTKVKAHELTKDDIKKQVHSAVSVTSISELLYADRVVFVEGPSDVRALEALTDAETHAGVGIRFQPLLLSDNARKEEYVTALYAVSRGFDSGAAQKAGLYFDDDKRGVIDKKWSSWNEHDPNTLFDVQWLGVNGHDMESLLADTDFLVAYFNSKNVSQSGFESQVTAVVDVIVKGKKPAKSEEKASHLLRALHDELLPAEHGGNKTDLLEAFATFYRTSTIKLPLVEALIENLKGPKP